MVSPDSQSPAPPPHAPASPHPGLVVSLDSVSRSTSSRYGIPPTPDWHGESRFIESRSTTSRTIVTPPRTCGESRFSVPLHLLRHQHHSTPDWRGESRLTQSRVVVTLLLQEVEADTWEKIGTGFTATCHTGGCAPLPGGADTWKNFCRSCISWFASDFCRDAVIPRLLHQIPSEL